MRKLGILCLGALAATITACASSGASQCEATGVVCPAGTHCAAAEPICISDLNLCGNARKDPGEVCDDGNNRDGDGCSADCKSDETCGNGTKDVNAHIPEVCDDGNTKDGDGCSHDCLSLETCGNKIVDIGEVCDDGNDVAGDGCSHSCKSNETCHNGIVDPGEACDPMPPDPTLCSDDCKSNLKCGNGTVDLNEECDVLITDSNNNVIATNSNDSDCRVDCVVNRCGDGFVDTQGSPGHPEHKEDCDPAPQVMANSRAVAPVETAECNIDCTFSSCGDGKINRHFIPKDMNGNPAAGPEQCDNGGANNDNADCTATCQINVCGDGHTDSTGLHREDCDHGVMNGAIGDTCTKDCHLVSCGNGVLDQGEECDDGANNGTGKRCNTSCKFNVCGDGDTLTEVEQCDGGVGGVKTATATCDADCTFPVCGDGVLNTLAGEGCDHGASNGKPGDTCSATCHVVTCGNGLLEQGEECDDGANNGTGKRCNANCKLNVCGDGDTLAGVEQCDDGVGGVKTDSARCDSDCTFPVCGDNHFNSLAGEGCDHGATDGQIGDSCSATCHIVTCGNGLLEQGEECDDGVNNGTGKRCNANCKLNVCGDGDTLIGVEQCDGGRDAMGNPKDTTTCDSDCTLPVCGDDHFNSLAGEGCDHGTTNGAAGDTCSTTCHIVTCGNGLLEQGEQCDDGMANGASKRCNANCKLNVCGDGDTLIGVEQCDGGRDAMGNPKDIATCDHDCTLPVCGDGVVNGAAGEDCDDGAQNGTAASPNHCDSFCHTNACGNGFIDLGEECDNGKANSDNADCTASCQINVCGDHLVDTQIGAHHEVCDDGASNGDACAYNDPFCQRCNSTCTALVSPGGPFCGDGIPQSPIEQCDPATGPSTTSGPSPFAKADSAMCNNDCTLSACGDGHVNVAAGETCDDGNTNTCGTCNATDVSCKGSLVTPTAATGSIQTADAVVGQGNIKDGDTFTLDDGFHSPVVFEFDVGGGNQVGMGHVPITLKGDGSEAAADVASKIQIAIAGQSALDITAVVGGTNDDVVTLTNKHKSSFGTKPIANSGNISASFKFVDMSGGLAGDCANTTGCKSNGDCASSLCTATATTIGACVACAADADCGPGRTCKTSIGACIP